MVTENWTDVDFAKRMVAESQVDVGTNLSSESYVGVFDESCSGILPNLDCCTVDQTISIVLLDNLTWPGQFRCHLSIVGTCLLGAQSYIISRKI